MLSPTYAVPAPAAFLQPGCARPFFPAPPLPLPQSSQGGFFGPPPNFLGPPWPPPPPVPPYGQTLVLPPVGHLDYCVSGGRGNWNFQHATTPQTPQFPAAGSSRWPQQRQPWKHPHNKRSKAVGANAQSGSGPKPVLFVCSPCHKEYKSQETYDIHLATHVKCSHCDFECSKGAMHDHELVHYLPAELNFTNQEDIEKWRAQRRRNFPTAERVLAKKELQERKERRGDVADTPLYRYVSRVCGSAAEGSSRQRRGRGGRSSRWIVAGSNWKHSPHGQQGGGVRADGEGRMERVDSRPHWKRRGRGRGGRGGRGRRGRNGGHRGKEASRSNQYGLKYVSAKKPTLLEKLLANEIRREQNTLLQCIRHVVRNDFFGAGDTVKNVVTGGRVEKDGEMGEEGGEEERKQEQKRWEGAEERGEEGQQGTVAS